MNQEIQQLEESFTILSQQYAQLGVYLKETAESVVSERLLEKIPAFKPVINQYQEMGKQLEITGQLFQTLIPEEKETLAQILERKYEMTQDQFEKQFSLNKGFSMETYRNLYETIKCDCGEPECKGFQAREKMTHSSHH